MGEKWVGRVSEREVGGSLSYSLLNSKVEIEEEDAVMRCDEMRERDVT